MGPHLLQRMPCMPDILTWFRGSYTTKPTFAPRTRKRDLNDDFDFRFGEATVSTSVFEFGRMGMDKDALIAAREGGMEISYDSSGDARAGTTIPPGHGSKGCGWDAGQHRSQWCSGSSDLCNSHRNPVQTRSASRCP